MKKHYCESNENNIKEIVDQTMSSDPNKVNETKGYAFYLKLRNKIKERGSKSNIPENILEAFLAIPDLFYLVFKLAIDKDISNKNKTVFTLVCIYFIAPIDFIPDGIMPFGFMDDVYLAVKALDSIINTVDRKYIDKYWMGDSDIIRLIQSTIKELNNIFDFVKLYRTVFKEEEGKAAQKEIVITNI